MQINPAVPGTLTRVASGNLGAPRISADGHTVVYTVFDGKQWDIMRWHDGQTVPVSTDPHNDVDPSVSGDGDTVVFSRYSSLDGSDPNGHFNTLCWHSGQAAPVAPVDADQLNPVLSTDAKVMAWSYDDPRQPTGFDIQECRGGTVQNVTDGWPVDIEPKLSADGSRVLFRRKIEYDDGDLWLHDEKGALKQLTHTPWGEFDAVVDAGAHTVVWSEQPNANYQLVRCNIDSGEQKVVAAETGADHVEPSLSADGAKMAWARRVSNGTSPTSQILLSDSKSTVPLTLDGYNSSPEMSADGHVLTWVSVEPVRRDGGPPAMTSVIYRFERAAQPT